MTQLGFDGADVLSKRSSAIHTFSRCQPRVIFTLHVHDDHLTRCKDEGNGLGFTNTSVVIAIVWWHQIDVHCHHHQGVWVMGRLEWGWAGHRVDDVVSIRRTLTTRDFVDC